MIQSAGSIIDLHQSGYILVFVGYLQMGDEVFLEFGEDLLLIVHIVCVDLEQPDKVLKILAAV